MDLLQIAAHHGLEQTLALQDGLLTRAQGIAAGEPVRRMEQRIGDGRWARVLPGVYLAPGFADSRPEYPERVRARAAWLWGGEDSVIAMHSAAWWTGLEMRAPTTVELWVKPYRRKDPQPGITVRRRRIDVLDTTWSDGIRVTSAARTAVDLAAAGSSDGLDALARANRVDLSALDGSLARGSGGRGWIRARAEVAGTTSNPWSAAERLLHADLFAAVIKDWDANVRMWVGGRTRVVDVRFRYVPLIIEVDGREHHGTAESFEGDRERDAELAALGWTVLRFTWAQLTSRSTWVLNTIRATIARLEGSPMPRDCTPTT